MLRSPSLWLSKGLTSNAELFLWAVIRAVATWVVSGREHLGAQRWGSDAGAGRGGALGRRLPGSGVVPNLQGPWPAPCSGPWPLPRSPLRPHLSTASASASASASAPPRLAGRPSARMPQAGRHRPACALQAAYGWQGRGLVID